MRHTCHPLDSPYPQGTLDMLILQVLSLESAHGYTHAGRPQAQRAREKADRDRLIAAVQLIFNEGA